MGDRYLVWSGQAGTYESSARADGWTFDPADGHDRRRSRLPADRTTLVCGRSLDGPTSSSCAVESGSDTGRSTTPAPAVVYHPDTGTWRWLADPPSGSAAVFSAAVWTGEEMIVVFGAGGDSTFGGSDSITPAAIAYNPQYECVAHVFGALAADVHARSRVDREREAIVWDLFDGLAGQRLRLRPGDQHLDAAARAPGRPPSGAMQHGVMVDSRSSWPWPVVLTTYSECCCRSLATGRRRLANPPRAIPGSGRSSGSRARPAASRTRVGDVTTDRPRRLAGPGNESFRGPLPLLTYDPACDSWREQNADALDIQPGTCRRRRRAASAPTADKPARHPHRPVTPPFGVVRGSPAGPDPRQNGLVEMVRVSTGQRPVSPSISSRSMSAWPA